MQDRDAALRRLAHYRSPAGMEDFAKDNLRVRNKPGDIVPFVFNQAQRILHERAEDQKRRKGWVRLLILKGRQAGISTYVAGRLYRNTTLWRGRNTHILAHEQSASDTLFGMVDRFQRNNPLRPHVGVSNIREMEFDHLESSYSVGTAGAKAGGRGKALSFFHGSEAAFWPNAPEHFASSVQAVPLLPDTEVFIESTSVGAGGEFYERCQDAEAGRGDYELVFLPWWLPEEYQRDPDPGFVLGTEEVDGEVSEAEYAQLYSLGDRQMAWRRSKIYELRDVLLFRREYPATVQDAWTAPPGHEPYIENLLVLRARKRRDVESVGPLIIGVDPASGGGDRFAVCWRRGLKVEKIEYRNKINHEEAVAWLRKIIDEDKPARMNIDAGNIGGNVVTALKNLGPTYAEVVRGVNFGGTSEHRLARPKIPGPYNRRAEMWKRGLEWLQLPEGVSLPDDGALQADICAPKEHPRLDNFFQLESKVDMKKRGVRSPDLADAWALTFAFKEYFDKWHQPAKAVNFGDIDNRQQTRLPVAAADPGSGGPTGWMAM